MNRNIRCFRFNVLAITIILSSFLFIFSAHAHDVNGDGQEGLAEAIHALQVAAGIIQNEDTNLTCTDGIDNDHDGYVDCDDFNCSQNPAVTVCNEHEDTTSLCTDTIDNDGDSFVDCDDFDCAGLTVCGGNEDTNALCSDGLDNDEDGYIDCDDYGCSQNSAVTVCEEHENTIALCTDTIDNDGDSFIDCDDFDCAGLPVCP